MAKIKDRKVKLKLIKNHPWNGWASHRRYFSLMVGKFKYVLDDNKLIKFSDYYSSHHGIFIDKNTHHSFAFEILDLDKVEEICKSNGIALINSRRYNGKDELSIFCRTKLKYFADVEIELVY
jgi:hypothetical protein